jgi:hypothetical protein
MNILKLRHVLKNNPIRNETPRYFYPRMTIQAATHAKAHRGAIRAQIAALPTVTAAQATAARATSITMPYQTRQIAQCQALLNVLADFATCPDRILIVDVGHGELEVWRKDALPV